MASGRKVAEVFVEVRANLSKLKSGMKSAMKIASGGASVIGRVLGGLASLIKNVLTAAFKVVGAVIKTIFNLVTALFSSIIKWAKRGVLALSAFVALSIVVGAKFGQSMARVKALTGASTKEFKELREEARRLGRATEYSANQAADAMSIFAMAGFKTNDVITAMAPTLDFAAASGLDLASAADIAARVMGGMQLQASDLEHTMDVLTKAFTSANMDATDLGEAMKFVGAVGKTVGKDVEELVGALTALAAAGNRGSMAGTGLRKVLMGLATSKIQKRLAKLGVSVTDTAGAMKPISKIVGDIGRATKNLSDMEIADLGVQMFGARGGVAFLQLVGQGEAAIEAYTKQLANVDGFTKKIAATQRDTLATAFKIVQSAIADVMITITDIFEPTMLGAADTQVKMWNKIGEVLETNKTRIQDFIKNTITWVKVNLPRAIHIAIGSLAQLWESFKNTFDGIKKLVGGTATAVGESLGSFFEMDSQTGTTLERVIGAFLIGMLKIKQAIVDIFERIKMGLYELELIKKAETIKTKMAIIEWLDPKRKEGDPAQFGVVPRGLIRDILGAGHKEEEVKSIETQLKLHRESLGFEADVRNEQEMEALRQTIRDAFEKEGDAVVKAIEDIEEKGATLLSGTLKKAGATFFGIKTQEPWRTALYQGSGRRAKQSELSKLQDSLKEAGLLTQTTDGKIELSDKGLETVERKVSRQGFYVDSKKEEAERLEQVQSEYRSMTKRRLELENELGIRQAKKQLKSFQGKWADREKPELEEKKAEGRKVQLPERLAAFSTTIQTVIGAAKVGVSEQLVWIRDTAESNRKILAAVDGTKLATEGTEKLTEDIKISSELSAEHLEDLAT